MPPLTIRRNRYRTALMVILSVLMTVGFLHILKRPHTYTFTLAFEMFGLLFFGLMGIGWLCQLKRPAVLILTSEGFYDYSTTLATGSLIPWAQPLPHRFNGHPICTDDCRLSAHFKAPAYLHLHTSV